MNTVEELRKYIDEQITYAQKTRYEADQENSPVAHRLGTYLTARIEAFNNVLEKLDELEFLERTR